MTLWTTPRDAAQSQCRRGLRHGAHHLTNAPSQGCKLRRACAPRVHRQRGIPCGQALGMWAETSTGAACNAVPAISSAMRAPAPRVHRTLHLHPTPAGTGAKSTASVDDPVENPGACGPNPQPARPAARCLRFHHLAALLCNAGARRHHRCQVHSHRGTPCGKALGMCPKANAGAACSAMPKISSIRHIRCSVSPQPRWKTLWTSAWHARQNQCRRGLRRGTCNLPNPAALASADAGRMLQHIHGTCASRLWERESTATVEDPVDKPLACAPKPMPARLATRCPQFDQVCGGTSCRARTTRRLWAQAGH